MSGLTINSPINSEASAFDSLSSLIANTTGGTATINANIGTPLGGIYGNSVIEALEGITDSTKPYEGAYLNLRTYECWDMLNTIITDYPTLVLNADGANAKLGDVQPVVGGTIAGGIIDIKDQLGEFVGNGSLESRIGDTSSLPSSTLAGALAQIVIDTGTTITQTQPIASIDGNIGNPESLPSSTLVGGMTQILTDLGSPLGTSVQTWLGDIIDTISSNSPYGGSSVMEILAGLNKALKLTSTTTSLSGGASQLLSIDTGVSGFTYNMEIKQIKVTRTGASTQFTVDIYEKSDASANNKLATYVTSNSDMNEQVSLIFINNDVSVAEKCYVKVTNDTDAGSTTFAVEVRGIRLGFGG